MSSDIFCDKILSTKNKWLICDFTKIPQTIEQAIQDRQIQPVIM